MATAMVKGLLKNPQVVPSEICCTGAADGTAEALATDTGIRHFATIEEALAAADCVVLAVKPQQLELIRPQLENGTEGRLIVSILAGTLLQRLQAVAPQARNVVRAMPNTPGQIGAGITAYAPAQPMTDADTQTVQQLLGAMGPVLAVEEPELDAVTGVSGSGPAYVFEFIAGLREAGIAAGLEASVAAQLALQTVLGAAELVRVSGETPESLRDKVTSPGGTTLEGLAVLKERDLHGILKETVAAAKRRSIELSQSA